MKVHFLGTMGWFTTSLGYTPSVLIDTPACYILLDLGEGVCNLDKYLKEEKPIYVFISHLHLDHLIGIHTFIKFEFKNKMNLYLPPGMGLDFLKILAKPFTVPPTDLKFDISIQELSEGQSFPFELTYLPVEHSDPCFAYRLKIEDRVIAYVTDTGLCENSRILALNADLLIHECAYLKGENIQGWPHTNPEQAAQLAKESLVKKLVLIHFDSSRYDTFAKILEAKATAHKIFKETYIARDGSSIEV